MQLGSYRTTLCALLLLAASLTAATAQQTRANRPVSAISTRVLLPIMRAEDERRWDTTLPVFLLHKEARVRKRAALAMGRIGDERAVPALIGLLRSTNDVDVRQMAAFALGEIESALGADALLAVLDDSKQPGEVRARAVEALGKIAAALPQTDEARRLSLGQVILKVLAAERKEGATTESGVRDRELELLGLTAVLRARPADAGKVVTLFLSSADPRVRADAANTLARLRAKDGVDELRMLLVDDQSPIARANAAKALGVAEDKESFDALLDRALHDDDVRVRVSAIRALGSLKDARVAEPLISRGTFLLKRVEPLAPARPADLNELLEIATVIGNILKGTSSNEALDLLGAVRDVTDASAPEVEVALARLNPEHYLANDIKLGIHSSPSMAQGLAEIAAIRKSKPSLDQAGQRIVQWMHGLLDCPFPDPSVVSLPMPRVCMAQPLTVSPMMRAYAAFGPSDLDLMLRQKLSDPDVVVRATAAELIGEQPPSDANNLVLIRALARALNDKGLNDAALAILDALAKQKSPAANDAIKTALDSSDHLIRRRAVSLLKANGAGDFSNRIGTVKTRNTEADYARAIARIGKHVTATVLTSKGSFTIEFLPEDAPLTVDNFVQLARKGYFNGVTFHRVVPNFVIQGGDPRGDGSGGPGYSIRCEINEVPYERAAVGMALSGKDTGGSQWFVTHAPQPHLDGGYTVFGRVIRGMDVVDRIARGDIIRRVVVNEKN